MPPRRHGEKRRRAAALQIGLRLVQGRRSGRGEGEADETILRRTVEAHFRHTGSLRAREILTDWANQRARFARLKVSATP